MNDFDVANANIKNHGKKFSKEYQPVRVARQKKFKEWKDVAEEIYEEDGFVTFKKEDVQILPDGSVKVKVPTQKMMMIAAMKNAVKDARYFDLVVKTTGGYITPKNPNEDMIEEVIRQDGGVVIIQQRFIGLI